MSRLIFSENAWEDYLYWQRQDKKTLKKINELLKDIQRAGVLDVLEGLGKPEALKYRQAWSRRIDHANRLIYKLDETENIIVIACRGHYED